MILFIRMIYGINNAKIKMSFVVCVLFSILYYFFQLEIKFRMGKPVKVTGNLINASDNSDSSELIFTQTQDDVVSFILQIPSEGFYKLQVYALPVTDESKTLPGVYNYLINCGRMSKPVQPFPKQYAQWKEGCYLHEPMFLKGMSGNTKFKVLVPKAKAVAVTFNDDWFQLNAVGNDVWEGSVLLDKAKSSKVTLNANYGGEELKYSTLLEYSL